MGTFFDDASLVMIPSGVKESKLYSIKPTDGTGDFTFTRGTDTATRVNSAGLIEKETQNLLLQSNQFDTTWANTNTTETSGQSGYDGSSNAWLLAKNAAFGRINQSISSSGVHTFSVYAKEGTSGWMRLVVIGTANPSAYFNLSNGAVGTTSNVIESNSQNIGNGWYRYSISLYQASITEVRIYPAEADNDIGGTSGNIYIQDAQLEQSLVARTYIETTTAAVYAGITDNLPRLDYSGGATCPSLLLEPQRTNLINNSEYLNAWNLQSGIVVSDNQTTSPEGVQNAGIATSAFSNSRIQQNLGTLGSNYIFSAFVKSDGVGTRMELRSNVTTDNIILDVAASGEVTHFSDTAVNNNYDIENYGNGWYRVWFEVTTSAVASNYYQILPDVQFGNRSVYVWGIQAEVGSYATSYIPTMGVSATRAADSCLKTGIADLLEPSNGTIFFEMSSPDNSSNSKVITIGSSSSERIQVFYYQDSIRLNLTAGGTSQAYLQEAVTTTDTIKVAVSYAINDVKLFVNGELQASDTSAAMPSALNYFRFDNGSGAAQFIGSVKQAIYFPTALTDSECIALTTL